MVDHHLFNLIDLRQKWTYQSRIISVKIKVNLTQSAKKNAFTKRMRPITNRNAARSIDVMKLVNQATLQLVV
jgi:hypothetical protein